MKDTQNDFCTSFTEPSRKKGALLSTAMWLPSLSAAGYYSLSLILQITLLLKVAEAATELLQRKNVKKPHRYWACLTQQLKWHHGLDRPTASGGLGGLASGSTQTLLLTMIAQLGSSASAVPVVSLLLYCLLEDIYLILLKPLRCK